MAQQIIGKVARIIYHSQQNSFTVMRFLLHEINEKQIFVTGHFPVYEKDTMLECTGLYQEHPKYGMQFVVEHVRRIIPQERESLINFLSSPTFKGIGKKTAEKFVDALGLDLIDQIKNNPDKRYIIESIPRKKQDEIIATILKTSKEDQMIAFVSMIGLNMRQLFKIQRVYGDDAIYLIRNNPYRLIDDIDGIGFKCADKVAMALGFDENDLLRQEAAFIDGLMQQCMRFGDSYVLVDDFLDDFDKKYDFSHSARDILDRVLMKSKVGLEDQRLYPLSQLESEKVIADFFLENDQQVEVHVEDLDLEIEAIQKKYGIKYDEQQLNAIVDFLEHKHLIITGGPGTGKTTLVLALIALCQKADPPVVIESCAPTGRAAKRLSYLSNYKASTIHSLLQWDLETNTFNRNEENPLVVDVLIVDEFSMVDTFLFAQLLKALPTHTKIIIIGDHNQIPSVAPGNVLMDSMESNVCPVITLKTIYRQQQGSKVIELAHEVLKGSFQLSFDQDVRMIEATKLDVKDKLIHTIDSALQKGYRIEDIQVLAPKYNGLVGIDALNHALQKAFNPADPSKRELQVGYRVYRENDKILQLKNQVDDQVFNGDIGVLVEIIYASEDENKQNRFIVDFDGNYVEYTPDMFINISHAYCMSVHKSQGNEYPIVVLLGFIEYGWMLQRRLYYTAITRAANYLICMGETRAFKKAVEQDKFYKRQTYLKQRLVVE